LSDDINILVVDDVAQNLVAMEALLARPGIKILKAASGPDALEILLVHEIALALVDVNMPQMDGFELAELIRGSARTRAVPLIFLTAGTDEAKKTFRGYEAGAVDFLYKPVDAAALKSKVNVFVELHAKEKQLSRQLDELRQALHLNEMFAAVLGHDLRNPLSSIMMGAEMMLAVSADPQVITTAERIRSSGKRMSRMVDQLLDVTRIRAGAIRLNLQDIDLVPLCRAIMEELSHGAHGKLIHIESVGHCVVRADRDRFEQIMSNLIANALQHGRSGTPVRVRVDGSSPRQVMVSVSSEGPIPEQMKDRIFTPFQTSRTDPGAGQGLGLGLYIVKQFVDAHGGNVTVDVDNEQCTVFRIVLPR